MVEGLNPTQQLVLDELFGKRSDRPEFPDNLADALRSELEGQLGPIASSLPGSQTVWVNKHALGQVHACERHHIASIEAGFSWTAATARGSVAHQAIGLGAFTNELISPMQLVDMAIDRFVEKSEGLDDIGAFLQGAGGAELAELKMAASDEVTKYEATFPPLKKDWRPRFESRITAKLCDDRIVLTAVPDLALGRPTATRAEVLLVDFKTGRRGPFDRDDLRFYALVHTLAQRVPPFRLATLYLDEGAWDAEDVTADLLWLASRRMVDGVAKIVETRVLGREPTINPGPQCGWCDVRDECEGGVAWRKSRQEEAAR